MAKNTEIEIQQSEVMEVPAYSPILVGIGATVSIISILAVLWKIASFLQSINFQIMGIHKDLCKLSKEQMRLQKRYENVYFFLLRQHGAEVVDKYFRHSEGEGETDHGD